MRSGRRSTAGRSIGSAMLLVTGLAAAALAPAPAAQAVIDPGSIAGTVTDLADRPLAGITVSVLEYNGSFMVVKGQDQTDATGAYQVDELAASSTSSPGYLVRFADPSAGWATEYYDDSVSGTFATTQVPVRAYATTSGVDASMEPAATISGRVTAPTGASLAGVQVKLWWNPPSYVIPMMDAYVTDEAGRYSIDRVKAGTYLLDFYDPASGNRESWNDQPPSAMYGPSLTATPLVVAAGAMMSGIDAVLGAPVVQTHAVTNVVRPRVKGTLRVGRVVRVSRGEWAPSTVALRYRWYAGGKAVAHATHRRLTLSHKLVGKRLTVRVTARVPGYTSAVVLTRSTARVRP